MSERPRPKFEKVPQELNFPKEEREILALWKEKRIFERSLEESANRPTFVFYEGPPTANGLPHNGHVLTRVMKDIFPRYKTMRGYYVARKAGWDTHGLPVEVEVEKELRIHGKAAIEEYGVEPFVKKCVDSVFRYTDEWARMTERVGFWVDLEDAYVTYHRSYVESVWWALTELFKKGLLYQGHKVLWWWAQGGTALSSGEVGLGYREVDDPSVLVRFPLTADVPDPSAPNGAPLVPKDASLLVWTTTPWTLPSNAYAVVHPKHRYVVVRHGEEAGSPRYVIAKDLVEAIGKKLKTELVVEREFAGADLIGARYTPPFDLYSRELGTRTPYWTVKGADYVTLDTGSGIVHTAPAFGEDDFQTHRKVLESLPREQADALPLLCAVKPDGTFVPELTRYAGRWVKDCDKEIQEELRERGLLAHTELYRHQYPFCWRASSDPLIQYARPAWYIRTTEKIQNAIRNNRTVEWLPEHIKEGRFGDFLANNVDWALSRERYWGTPLNIWINDKTGKMEAPDSVDAILAKNPRAFDAFHEAKKKDPSLSPHLIVHKPWIDQVTWQNPGEEGTYRRVGDVIDCWFDSGAMPFAQWGFPHTGQDKFAKSFPADFISEAIDQTRGWFYTLLMIATLVFDEECQKRYGLTPREYPLPYKTCVVLGHISDKEGKKESKSVGNYTPPEVILDCVRMEFAVLDGGDGHAYGVTPTKGTAYIAREDLEGLDLKAGSTVLAYRLDGSGERLELKIEPAKKLRRRVVVLHPDDVKALGATFTAKTDVKPVEVPWLPAGERIVIEDPSSSAPGADAFRWFFYASNPPWSATRHSLTNVRTLQKETLIKLRNVYSFFTIYASIDGFDPDAPRPALSERSELDRWMLDLVGYTTKNVRDKLDAYQLFEATKYLVELVDALSNWYVRRSRDRFWKTGWDADKSAAYATLYESLVTLTGLFAPFVPFVTEDMYQNLVVRPARVAGKEDSVPPSVHLTSYPEPPATFDDELRSAMYAVRDLVSLGLQVRTQAKLKVRQPLRSAHVIVSDKGMRKRLARYEAMIREELNVLEVEFVEDAQVRQYVTYKLKPNFRTLGQRGLGKEAQSLKKVLAEISAEEAARIHGELAANGTVVVAGVSLLPDDLEVAFTTHEGFSAAGDRVGVVVLETTLDDELRDLGFLREVQSRVQAARKDQGLEYTDRIKLWLSGGERLERIASHYGASLAKEVLATEIVVDKGGAAGTRRSDGTGRKEDEVDIDGETVGIAIEKIG
ncbi:isoleucine--tRNA ligase [Pendulispora albinea]|uniref:Isoleucine--tRNA ligase n=1 Tax=Pendulispora albinea TaxID=2741071 RepID=A0ABZ2LLR8_9BACT